MTYLSQVPSFILLVLGFGFVVFWHELGHFLAAKWAGVKVEQFAVGFGQALFSWRKGIGARFGNTQAEYEKRIAEYIESKQKAKFDAGERLAEQIPAAPEVDKAAHEERSLDAVRPPTTEEMEIAAEELGLGETEYRINWIPLGGYVKMLGQDDLRPNAQQTHPRAYNMKPVSKRMVIVSAGVIMNIILAMVGFMILFRVTGFNAPPALVGGIVPGSPAQKTTRMDGSPAPLQVGDRVLDMNGIQQHDFTKISLNTALLEEGESVPLHVKRRDGHDEQLKTIPARMFGETKGFLMLGIMPPYELRGIKARDEVSKDLLTAQLLPADALAIRPGDVISSINGQSVDVKDFQKFDDAIQKSNGKPVPITVADAQGKNRNVEVHPHIERPFDKELLDFAGMLPRPSVELVQENSTARGKLLPGDVVVRIVSAGDLKVNPTAKEFTEWLTKAGSNGQSVDITVLRGGDLAEFKDLHPSLKVAADRYGLGIQLGTDDQHAIVAGTVESSPARAAGIPNGATITNIAGQAVGSWFDVRTAMENVKDNQPFEVTYMTSANDKKTASMTLNPEQKQTFAMLRYGHNLRLGEYTEPRKTSSTILAAKWGIIETRDFVLQFYLTMRRMFQGSVSYTNMMGPVGIFHAGTKLAYKGNDWLIWFLSMISANLAVVNFLPIPIVDGGLFTFLILEKIKGKPLSARAQSIAQVVGLALLLGVFLLVTYQDINRLF